jgi:hypothetical protein
MTANTFYLSAHGHRLSVHVVTMRPTLQWQCNNLPVGSSVAIQVSNSGSSGDGSCHFSSSCGDTSGLPSWDVSPGHSAQSGTIFITSACNFGYTVKNEDIIHSNHCLVAVQFMLPTPSPSVTPTRTPPPSPSRTASPSHVLSSVASASPSPSGRWPPSSDQHAGATSPLAKLATFDGALLAGFGVHESKAWWWAECPSIRPGQLVVRGCVVLGHECEWVETKGGRVRSAVHTVFNLKLKAGANRAAIVCVCGHFALAAKRLLYGLVGGGAAAILCLGVAFVIRRRARGGSATAEELQTLVPGEHPNQDTGRAAVRAGNLNADSDLSRS